MMNDKYQITQNGNGASRSNEIPNPRMFRGSAEYLSSVLGFTADINKLRVI